MVRPHLSHGLEDGGGLVGSVRCGEDLKQQAGGFLGPRMITTPILVTGSDGPFYNITRLGILPLEMQTLGQVLQRVSGKGIFFTRRTGFCFEHFSVYAFSLCVIPLLIEYASQIIFAFQGDPIIPAQNPCARFKGFPYEFFSLGIPV